METLYAIIHALHLPLASKVVIYISTVLGGLGGILLVRDWFMKTFLKKHILKKKISKLAVSTTINYFVETFGSPIFVNLRSSTKQYVFISEYCYVDAITDMNDKVRLFSVTTKYKNFNPVIILGPYTSDKKSVKIKLGKSRFIDLEKLGWAEGKVYSGCGNRRAFYVEEYYFGNPGYYLTYALSANQAGPEGVNASAETLNLGASVSSDPRIQSLRKNSIINTYTISSDPLTDEDINVPTGLGVDYDQIRLVDR